MSGSPVSWYDLLQANRTSGAVRGREIGESAQDAVLAMQGEGICECLQGTLGHWLDELRLSTSGHDPVIFGQNAIIGDAAAGHTGAYTALCKLKAAAIKHGMPPVEWSRNLRGTPHLVSLNGSRPPDPCADEDLRALQGMKPGAKHGQNRRIVLTPASKIKMRAVRWLWDGWWPLGGLSLLAGREGLGKSTIYTDRVARVTRGTLSGEYEGEPKPVIICTTEDEWSYTVLPRLVVAGADLDLVFNLTVESGGSESALVFPVDTEMLADAVSGSGAVLLVLDPLTSRISGKLDTHKDGEVRRGLEPVVKMAGKTGASVLGLTHINKSAGPNALDSVMASKAFTAVPRSVLMAVEHPDPELRALDQCVLFHAKVNIGPKSPARVYEIVERVAGDDPEDGRAIVTSKVRWLDELDGWTVNEAIAEVARSSSPPTKTGDAESWLLGYIHRNGGRVEPGKAKTDGERAGHKPRTIDRAVSRSELIVAEKTGFPAKTFWVIGGDDDDE